MDSGSYKLSLFCLFIVLTSYVCVVIATPLSVFNDSSYGFHILSSLERGAQFNYDVKVSADNIADSVTSYLSWWSPGQYVVPGLFRRVLHLNLNSAMTFTIVICAVVGLAGFYRLFTAVGFSKEISILSLLLISTQRYFNLHFNMYHGGEILLFAGLPWIILLHMKFKELSLWGVTVLMLANLSGYFLKSSYLIALLAILLFLLLVKIANDAPEGTPLTARNVSCSLSQSRIYLLRLVLLASVSYLIIKVLLIRNGAIPSDPKYLHFKLLDIITPLGAPLNSALSLQFVIAKLTGLDVTSNSNFASDRWVTLSYCAIGALSLMTLFRFWKSVLSKSYKLLLLSFCFVYLFAFTSLYVLNAEVSYEMRHFQVLGILLVPGMLHLLMSTKSRLAKALIAAVLIATSCYGMFGFVNRVAFMRNNFAVGREGNYLTDIDREYAAYLAQLDRSITSPNNVVFVANPDLSLEFVNLRAICQEVVPVSLDRMRYRGRVEKVYIGYKREYENTLHEKKLMGIFPDYHDHQTVFEGRCYKVVELR
jgi:hypothetical protein